MNIYFYTQGLFLSLEIITVLTTIPTIYLESLGGCPRIDFYCDRLQILMAALSNPKRPKRRPLLRLRPFWPCRLALKTFARPRYEAILRQPPKCPSPSQASWKELWNSIYHTSHLTQLPRYHGSNTCRTFRIHWDFQCNRQVQLGFRVL